MKSNGSKVRDMSLGQSQGRSWVVVLCLVFAAAMLLGLLRLRTGTSRTGTNADDGAAESASDPSGAMDPSASSTHDGIPAAATASKTRDAIDEDSLPPGEKARRLIQRLSVQRFVEGRTTEDAVNAFRHDLLKLEGMDAAALPAMEEFFDRRENVRYDTGPGTNVVGIPSLRIALMQLLLDFSAPANEEFQGRLLTTVSDPEEVALLAKQLEIAVPGQYRDAIVEAAKASLAMIREGRFPGSDPSPLLKLLERFAVAEEPPEHP